MPLIERRRGLCVTCKNEGHCNYPWRNGTKVTQCEGFEPYRSDSDSGVGVKVPFRRSYERGVFPLHRKPHRRVGLCASCKHREHCTLSKPAGGVLKCLEYE